MTEPAPPTDLPMAEGGARPSGADLGGVRASTESGVADWAQRSSERGDDPAIGRASTGNASGGAAPPRDDLGGKDAPGSAGGASARSERPASEDRVTSVSSSSDSASPGSSTAARTSGAGADDDEEEWRHPPVAPIDEHNPLRSLGKAVSDTLTNSEDGTPDTPTPKR